MALNPVETLNVFDEPLRKELRKRSLSKNLVRTRAPFLRFTTAANVSDLITENDNRFVDYSGCEFFTLGVHGYNEINYSADDLYGTQATKGLVVGTTYTNRQQKLVHTFGGLEPQDSAKNYPPPGITSAKVERLRNGNVLRFTIETQCYTQEQLEMLDALCYVPGMTCVLEWGTQFSTPTSQEKLTDLKDGAAKILDFKNVDKSVNDIRDAIKISRTTFIERWCKPNNYNYDWAVANIANVKTRVENNIYKTTVVAYGRADNIMYISAYATANPINEQIREKEKDITKSVTEYFKLNGQFSKFLDSVIITPTNVQQEYRNQIITFRDTAERRNIINNVPTSQQTGTINDLGFENVYFITFDFFVRYILNDSRNGLLGIINKGLSDTYKLDALISPLVEGADVIGVGYNKFLRSTSPETMLIYNPNAITAAAQQPKITTSILNNLQTNAASGNTRRAVAGIIASGSGIQSPQLTTIREQPFGADITAGNESGITVLSRGVWLNSKAIQSAFLNARTVMEGLEVLLRNINAATENYWDLKLYYDDDKQQFRILDDNNRTIGFDKEIYEFNKKLASTDGDTIGPDVIDIQVATDYPKLLFSQLAISGINGGNLSSSPQRTDYDFVRRTSVRDILSAREASDPLSDTLPFVSPRPDSEVDLVSFAGELARRQGILSQQVISNTLAGFGRVSEDVQALLTDLFTIQTLLTEGQAQIFINRLQKLKVEGKITENQVVGITNLFALRSRAIIRGLKEFEIQAFTRAYNSWRNADEQRTIRSALTDRPITEITKKVNASREEFIKLIDDAVGVTPEQQREQELREFGAGSAQRDRILSRVN
jgi:hypothetical protein